MVKSLAQGRDGGPLRPAARKGRDLVVQGRLSRSRARTEACRASPCVGYMRSLFHSLMSAVCSLYPLPFPLISAVRGKVCPPREIRAASPEGLTK